MIRIQDGTNTLFNSCEISRRSVSTVIIENREISDRIPQRDAKKKALRCVYFLFTVISHVFLFVFFFILSIYIIQINTTITPCPKYQSLEINTVHVSQFSSFTYLSHLNLANILYHTSFTVIEHNVRHICAH